MSQPQLVAQDLRRSFRIGSRRIDVLRGISLSVERGEAVFLCGGEQQRVAIARALTNDPDIVFADEPTGNLDSKTGDAIIDLLLQLARSRKKTLLVVTHDTRLAELGDRQLHIADGVLG